MTDKTPKVPTAISKEDVLDILAVALVHCTKQGIIVHMTFTDNELRLVLDNVTMNAEKNRFIVVPTSTIPVPTLLTPVPTEKDKQ